jgi:hypothetical protein
MAQLQGEVIGKSAATLSTTLNQILQPGSVSMQMSLEDVTSHLLVS